MPSQSYKRNTNRKCPYADSCFECPLPDCKCFAQEIVYTNMTEYDLFQSSKKLGLKGNKNG